ncbi:MAG: DUF2069 domain-containing protein [Pseudomonas sp.]|uniref:DUF2069 domain-containing protein n=1 Tax=Pseudomonas sp. TaxID=306 RepID=UPI002736B7FC|nr:DUF2069 domain-containing protein [Pseudomonas sp.]MDP3844935.1 DUF2069 domain-containing protein [Pseudomonas sp.]
MAKTPKPLPELSWLQPRLRISRAISLFSFFALALLILLWNLFFADLNGARPWGILLFALTPLALLTPGMLAGHPRASAWLCFVVNGYFIAGVLAVTGAKTTFFDWALLCLSLALFCSALMYTRWRFQYDRKLAGE